MAPLNNSPEIVTAVPKKGSNSFYMFSAACAALLIHLSTSCHIYILFPRAFVFSFSPSPIIHQSFSQKQGRSPGTKAVFLNKSTADSKISGGTNSSWCKSAEANIQVRGPVPCYTTCLPKGPARCPHQRHSWEVAKAVWGYEPQEKRNCQQQNRATAAQ